MRQVLPLQARANAPTLQPLRRRPPHFHGPCYTPTFPDALVLWDPTAGRFFIHQAAVARRWKAVTLAAVFAGLFVLGFSAYLACALVVGAVAQVGQTLAR
jgi:hypothetical protein